MRENQLNTELIIIKVYYFGVAENIIKNGFMLGDEKYVFFSASAGQIRTKKFVVVKESLLNECWNTLTCGLTVDIINAKGGVNINKYLAYLALCNSATDEWTSFNVDRCIVVEDFETSVNGTVDFIDEKTYTIERKSMAVPITHTDGCGMILPSVSKKNFMCRAPWIKGLLSPFPFDKFIREANKRDSTKNHGIVKDIYGKEHDILGEEIEVIFTKSQFKMYKFFESWEEYCEKFTLYGCTAGKCNEEENYISDAKFNYQMMQTLVDLTDEEIEAMCQITNNNLKEISSSRKVMLKVFGATPDNEKRNNFQECLMLYPELLQDVYTREILRDLKKSMEKEAHAGRIDIKGKYLFLIPDLYAFCEHLFLHIEEPEGLLQDGEVYCRVFPTVKKLDCLRSPHLYIEHAVRQNVTGENPEHKRWYITSGIYTSCHDLISKILQFDVDGDRSLVCADETIVTAAERNCDNIVPLYYSMAKAPAQQIDYHNLYAGMITAYTGGNIGEYSNSITKIWNSKNPNLEAIKLLCMENNFTIDYAKTLYKPVRPDNIDAMIKGAVRGKVPHFFLYAKDKEIKGSNRHKKKKKPMQIEPRNQSCVNRLCDIIKLYKFDFSKKQLGYFDYKMLMNDSETSICNNDKELIDKYYQLSCAINCQMNGDDENNNYHMVFEEIKNKLLEVEPNIYHLTDVLILQLFHIKKARHKVVFWNCFGNIVFENLQKNVDQKAVMCEDCGKRFLPPARNVIRCLECQAAFRKDKINENAKAYYTKITKLT